MARRTRITEKLDGHHVSGVPPVARRLRRVGFAGLFAYKSL